jgi:hypothetical protein
MMKFDETNLKEVAGIVARLNPHARCCGDLVAYMKAMARRELSDRCSYCGTLGFMLTSYMPSFDPGVVHIKASVDACAFFGVKMTVEEVAGRGEVL